MYKCRNCEEIFRNPDTEDVEPYQVEVCPECGSSDFVEVQKCNECGDYVEDIDVYGGLCTGCLNNKVNLETVFNFAKSKWGDLQNLFESIFDDEEQAAIIKEALNKKRAMARLGGGNLLSLFDKRIKEYALEDKYAFGSYIERQEKKAQ